MYITKLSVKDFGKFHNQEYQLQPGVNLIYGGNEAGKSTLQDFIIGMFYGIDKSRGLGARSDTYSLRKPYDRAGFSGSIEVYAKGNPYHVYRNFLRHERETKVTDMRMGNTVPLPNAHQLVDVLFDVDKETYLNTLCIKSSGAATDQALTNMLKDELVNMSTSGAADVNRTKAVQKLRERKKAFSVKELDRQMKQLSEELYREDDTEQQLQDIAREYQQLNESRNAQENRVSGIDTKELYTVKPKKKTEKTGIIMLITFLLTICLMVGIYYLPVTIEAKTVLWVGTIVGIIYMLISTMTQKKRFLSTQKRKKLEKEKQLKQEQEQDMQELVAYTNQLASLKVREEQLLEKQRAKQKQWEQYDALKDEKEYRLGEAKALDLAIATIEQLSNSIYNGFGGQLSRRVSRIMEQITEGKYSKVFVDEQLQIQVFTDDNYIPMSYLSTGTKEQLYFALRMVASGFMEVNAMPLLLDDIFTAYDDQRLYRTLEFLAKMHDRQIILFTANPRIADIFDEIGRDYNYIEL